MPHPQNYAVVISANEHRIAIRGESDGCAKIACSRIVRRRQFRTLLRPNGPASRECPRRSDMGVIAKSSDDRRGAISGNRNAGPLKRLADIPCSNKFGAQLRVLELPADEENPIKMKIIATVLKIRMVFLTTFNCYGGKGPLSNFTNFEQSAAQVSQKIFNTKRLYPPLENLHDFCFKFGARAHFNS